MAILHEHPLEPPAVHLAVPLYSVAGVHVDPDLGEIRVQHIVASYGVGRLLNRKTGHSQLMGGIVWGIGLALLEET
ncbi:MAG: xanthine dehydrogenase YagR molybdenum-binding subunit, partial [Burkholderiales bacterium]